MRILLATTLLSAVSIPALAQPAKKSVPPISTVIATGNYESQKTNLKAMRVISLAQLRALGTSGNGKVIELRGQVKGSFVREGSRALLFQLAEAENIVIEAPADFKSAATETGAKSRLLCRVSNATGATVSLSLINATNAPDPTQLFKSDDSDIIVAPPANGELPAPEQIMIGPDAPLEPPRQTTRPRNSNGPKQLPSRGLPTRPAPVPARRANPYFGFDSSQQAAFKSLARRHNPRLSDEMASYISSAILSASQDSNLDPRFLAAIVQVESSFDPYCLSSSGAMGLGQLMPFNLRPLGVSNAWDPVQNLRGAARLLRQNLDTFAGQSNGTLLAVAAYHAGAGAVKRAGRAVPPRAATQKYVWKVYYAYRALAPELFNN